MARAISIRRLVFAVGVCATCQAGPALAGIHTWDVNEVFSNAAGTIQFVELWEAAGGATEVNVGNGSISSNTQTFAFGKGPVTGPTSNKFYLLATQGFADLAGAPTPDAIIPSGSVPFFSPAGDTVAFGVYDSWTFGAVPTNGTDSLDRLVGVGANTPTNYAGETGSVDSGSMECGGFVGLPCGAGEFCEFEAGFCCCDVVGVCTQVPEVCTFEFDPVCGCDGQTYSNPCEAAAARVSIDSHGACDPPLCEEQCQPGEECFSGSGVLVSGAECILFEADSGGVFLVDSTGFEVDDRVSVTGCLDLACVSFCGSDACIDGMLVPEPGSTAAVLTALSTLLLLRHRAARPHGRRPEASR